MNCPYCKGPTSQGKATVHLHDTRIAGKKGLYFRRENGDEELVVSRVQSPAAFLCEDCFTMIIRGHFAEENRRQCPACGEQSPENFELCWKCRVPLA